MIETFLSDFSLIKETLDKEGDHNFFGRDFSFFANEPVLFYHPGDDTIVYANNKFIKEFGYTKEDITGWNNSIYPLFNTEDQEAFRQSLKALSENEGSTEDANYRLVSKDRKNSYYRVKLRELHKGYYYIQLENSVLEDKIEELNKSNSELEEFAYVASHDMQEPLRKISTFGQRLKVQCSDQLGEDGNMYLSRMLGASENMRNLIDNLLEFSRVSRNDRLQREADKHCLRLKLVPDMSTSFSGNLELSYLGDFTVLSQRREPLEEMENRFKKRLFDIIFSSLVIVFILSWLYPIIAILIKLQSPGPVLFKQLRTGKDNRSILCYKFRSMKVNDDTDRQATKNDDRITKIGAFLRKSSLDELPQFFNVFKGDMSVIGPRPHPLNMTKEYSQFINQYMVRHFLKSGITGWAQVSGFRGETKDPELMQKRVLHDLWYLEHWSMWLDIKIVFMTVMNVFNGEENAY